MFGAGAAFSENSEWDTMHGKVNLVVAIQATYGHFNHSDTKKDVAATKGVYYIRAYRGNQNVLY